MHKRTISAALLVLAIFGIAVLFFGTQDRKDTKTPENAAHSLMSGILSRLSMLPIGRRPVPVAVVIENHEDARPFQEGLSEALMVQEYLVEGFISRFIVLFDSRRFPREVGPVRSLRPYFLDGAAPWTHTFFHAGGSPEALSRVRNKEFYGLNLLFYDDKRYALRKEEVPAPHNLFLRKSLLSELLAEIPKQSLKPVSWPPFEVGIPRWEGEKAETIRLNFFSSTHNVAFVFQPLAEKYERTNGDIKSEARPSSVIILEVPIDSIGENGRLFMTLKGGGRALVFHSGKLWEGRWSRGSITEPFRLTDSHGDIIPIPHGQIWITVLPTLERVTWE